MEVRYYPEDGAGEGIWLSALDSIELSKEDLRGQIIDLFQVEQPHEVILRLLSPGKSGARVAVASFIDKTQRQCDWVIKLVPRRLLNLLQQELAATNKYAKDLYQNLEVRKSLGCIAFRFAKVNDDLGSYLAKACTKQDAARAIERTFATMARWYSCPKPTAQTFFDLYRLSPEVEHKLEEIGEGQLVELWHNLRHRWPIAKGLITSVVHGDLNQSNILLCTDGAPLLIDYALTGEKHWALDFARLERQVKFVVGQEFPESMSAVVDSTFDFCVPSEESAQNRVLAAVAEIRRQARKHFETAVNQFGKDYTYPDFAQEYFHALAFQQLCLIGSNNWHKSEKQFSEIALSTRRLLGTLLVEQPQGFFFGYFACRAEDKERILLRKDANGCWCFPVCGFVPSQTKSVEFAIDQAVTEFINRDDVRRGNYISSGFLPVESSRLLCTDSNLKRLEWDNQVRFVVPYFFRVLVDKQFDLMGLDYFWTPKGPQFENVKCEGITLECGQPALKRMVCSDFVREEYGMKVLECCDIIVFREKKGGEDEPEFLMLQRRDLDGWEYPKGGMEYHETLHEGAVRELLEETGIGQIGDFIPGGELGFQTADVKWRAKDEYDALRVRGVTYFFAGNDADIKLSKEHTAVTWMSLEEARDKLWIGPYGKEFLARWKRDQLKIRQRISRPVSIAFQVTEKCGLSCRYCLRRTASEETMDVEQIEQMIDILKQRGVQRLTVTGGEPLLIGKPKLFGIVQYANNIHLHTCLSTTGIGLNERDIRRLERVLDQLLLSLHSLTSATDAKLFEEPGHGAQMRQQLSAVLAWLSGSPLKVEISTVVSKVNAAEIAAIGRWIFDKHGQVGWRLEEYYANGAQDSMLRKEFELSDSEFDKVTQTIMMDSVLAELFESGRIKISPKGSRQQAPDVMITPQGNLVTSAANRYEMKGYMATLLYWDFKNRRPWSDYRRGIREDWDW